MIADYGQTTLTLADDQLQEIDNYVRMRLARFVCAGTVFPAV